MIYYLNSNHLLFVFLSLSIGHLFAALHGFLLHSLQLLDLLHEALPLFLHLLILLLHLILHKRQLVLQIFMRLLQVLRVNYLRQDVFFGIETRAASQIALGVFAVFACVACGVKRDAFDR